MSVRSRIATAAVTLGALGIAGPVAASSAATIPVSAQVRTVAPIVAFPNATTVNAAWTTGQQAAQAGISAGAQAAIGGWQAGAQAGVNGWLAGMQAAKAGINADATALGLPVVP